MITMTPSRVEFDDCEYADDQSLLYQGEPYTGVVFETYADGSPAAEQSYRQGILDGLSRVWHPNHQLKSETMYAFGLRVYERQWHENGKPKLDRKFDGRAKLISEARFDEAGVPIKS
jgi:antitoxin component YwqK of YwqJK toxin-antitoxin module